MSGTHGYRDADGTEVQNEDDDEDDDDSDGNNGQNRVLKVMQNMLDGHGWR